eukprot:3904115-Pyramimonas_sp.AAC.1
MWSLRKGCCCSPLLLPMWKFFQENLLFVYLRSRMVHPDYPRVRPDSPMVHPDYPRVRPGSHMVHPDYPRVRPDS